MLLTRVLEHHLLKHMTLEDRVYDRQLIGPIAPLLVRMTNVGVQADPAFVRSEGDRLVALMAQISATHQAKFGQSLQVCLNSW